MSRQSAGGAAFGPDVYDLVPGGDNTRETAQPLNEAQSWQQHNFHVSADQDWMTYYLGEGLTSTVTVEPITPTTAANWQITLKTVRRNPTTNEWEVIDVGSPTQFGPQGTSVVGTATIAGGQGFWVQVQPTNGAFFGTASPYRIRVTTALTPPFSADAFDLVPGGDNTRETAQPLNEAQSWQQHNFHISADQDWMTYYLGEGLTSTVTVEPITPTTSTNWQITLKTVRRNPTTNEWEVIDVGSPTQFGPQGTSVIGTATIAGGQGFWVQVQPTTGAFFGTASPYRIRVTTASAPTFTADAYDLVTGGDNTRETAQPLNQNEPPQLHNFHVVGDQDWMTFVVGQGLITHVTAEAVTPTTDDRWQITLKTVRRHPVTNEWEVIDAAPVATFGPQSATVSSIATLTGSQGYWVQVRSVSGTFMGPSSPYRVSVTLASPPSVSSIGVAPTTSCTSAGTGTSGLVPLTPGRWGNPDRNGTGWDFSLLGSASPSQLLLASWYTYDAVKRPTWYVTQPNQIQDLGNGERFWWSPLYRVTWNNGISAANPGIPVGEVSVHFLPNDPTRLALRWKLDGVNGGQTSDECVIDLFRADGRAPEANAGYSGHWHEPAFDGYGVQIGIAATGSTYAEVETLNTYDVTGVPVWVQGVRTGLAQPPADAQPVTIPLMYHTSPFPGGVPTTLCTSASGCNAATTAAGWLTRTFSNANHAWATISAETTVNTGLTTQSVSWKRPVGAVGQVQLRKASDAEATQVLVSRAACTLGASPCTIIVNWVTSASHGTAPRVYRRRLDGATATFRLPIDNSTGEYTDTLTDAGSYRYELKQTDNPEAANLALSANVTATSGSSTQPPEPYVAPSMASMAPSDAVGATTGSFRVSESGDANYSVPLYTAPSAGGTGPQMALSYSSGSSFGAAGAGWSIQGLSAISRCRRTVEHGDISNSLTNQPAVSLTTADAYCLDGQRLVSVTRNTVGVCGNANEEYRTEVDSFRAICGFDEGTVGGGHAYFAVYGKDGTISVYGRDQWSPAQGGSGAATHTSRLIANSGVTPRPAISWSISRVEDTAGNLYDYAYTKDEVNGEQYLAEVRYNANRRVVLAQTPDHKLRFNYVSLPANEVEHGRVATASTRQSKVLSSIDSLAGVGDQWLRHYSLRYSEPQAGARRTLAGVTECSSSNPDAICYPETQFAWTSNNVVFASSSIGSGAENGFEGLAAEKFGDVNGDGLLDIIWLKRANSSQSSSAVEEFWISTTTLEDGAPVPGGGMHFRWDTEIPFTANQDNVQRSWHIFDYNGDGRDDLLRLAYAGRSYQWKIHLSVPIAGTTRFTLDTVGVDSGIYAGTDRDTLMLSDFTGDGLPDVLAASGETGSLNLNLYRMERSGIQGQPYRFGAAVSVFLNTDDLLLPGDTLGDRSTPHWSFAQNFRALNKFQPIDVNADGRADLSAVLYTVYMQGPVCTPQSVSRSPQFLSDADLAAARDGRGSGASSFSCYVPHPVILKAKGLNAYGQFEFSAFGPRLGQGCFVADNGVTASVTGTIETGSVQYADFSGDGYADALYKQFNPSARTSCNTNETDEFAFRLNRGDGYAIDKSDSVPAVAIGELDPVTNSDDQDGGLQFLDVNSDGRADLVYPRFFGGGDDDPQNRYKVRYWNGSSFDSANDFPNGTAKRGNKSWKAYLIDLDNDGWVEGLRLKPFCSSAPCTTHQVLPSANAGRPAQRIEIITTGLGAGTALQYAPLSDNSVYQRGVNTAGLSPMGRGSPVFDLYGSLYVVKSASSSAPTATNQNAMATVRYFYHGGRIQGGGRGFLGFSELHTYADVLQASEPSRRMRTITRYRQDFPFVGTPVETVQELVDVGSDGLMTGAVFRQLSRGTTAYVPRAVPATPAPLTVLRQQEEAFSFDLESGAQVSGSRTHYTQYDNYGSVVTMSVSDLDADGSTLRSASTTNVYGSDVPNSWLLGRLTQTTVVHSVVGIAGTETRISQFEYQSGTGLLWGEVVEPNGAADETLRKAYELDAYGNRIRSATCSNVDFPTRAACLDASAVSFLNHWDTASQQQRIKRMGRAVYDSRGRFVREAYVWAATAGNGFLQQAGTRSQWTDESQFDRFGNPMRTESANGGIAQAQYGPLGREHARWSNDGAATETRYAWCAGSVICPAGMSYRIETTVRAGAKTWTYHDVLGRARFKLSEGYADTSDPEAAALGFTSTEYIAVQTEYDLLGRAMRSSEPYFAQGPTSSNPAASASGAALYWTETLFDAQGRATRINLPEAGAYSESVYAGLTTTVSTRACANISTCPLQTRTETRNNLGQLIETIDANGMKVWNTYDVQGRLRFVDQGRTVAEPTLRITVGYNKVGHKTSMTDPDKGTWAYVVNALGEVVRQTDAKGQRIESSYDAQGRVWRRVDLRGNGTTEAIAAFEFDTAPNGLGAISEETSSIGTFSKRYFYDVVGRPRQVETRMDSVTAPYTVQSTFDAYGRVDTQIDASGDAIRTEYTQRGFAKRQREAAGVASGSVLNEVRRINARGQLVEERRGGLQSLATVRDYWPATGRLKSIISGGGTIQNLYYEWDFVGNLKFRRDQTAGSNVAETFTYDVLNRLQTVSRSVNGGAATVTLSMGYLNPQTNLDLGNIQSKSDVGTYSYAGSSCNSTAGPHAVTNAGGVTYCYDANGNQTSSTDGRSLTYSVFDKPLNISSTAAGGDTVSFSYGTGRELIRRADANGTQVTRFVGGIEVLVNENATRRQAAGTIVKKQGSTRTLSYVFTDHLGSVSAIVGANAVVQQRQSFDAYGARRAPSDWQSWSLIQQYSFDTSLTRKGFTGHEGVERTGLIHFGGRLYDPRLGRFVQADPLVEDANLTNGLNRYSYVLNNPLSLTDPTGYLTWSEARPVVAIAVAIVMQNYAGAAYTAMGITNGLAQAAITGAVSGAVGGGSRGAVMGAFSAAMFYGIGSSFQEAAYSNRMCSSGTFGTGLTGSQFAAKVALHGMAGGVMNVLGGGKFGHGFASAAGTQFSSPVIDQIGGGANSYRGHRIAMAAVVGGTIAEVTGGKFANGAITGAFSRAFNDEVAEHSDSAPAAEGDGLSEHILENPEERIGTAFDVNGDGQSQCVEFLQSELSAPRTGEWRAGRKVLDLEELPIGTAIMTADDSGLYPSGSPRHAAIFMGFGTDAQGRRTILVIDQWYNRSTSAPVPVGSFGYPVGEGGTRPLRQGAGGPNNADLYWTARW